MGPSIDAIGPAFPAEAATQFVFDATTHEQDIRGGLARPGARTASSVLIGLGFLEARLDGFVRSTGAPTLEVRSSSWTCVLGEGAPEVEVEADTFELLRAFSGRRSVDQLRALAWTGSPEPYLPCLFDSPIPPRSKPLVEPPSTSTEP